MWKKFKANRRKAQVQQQMLFMFQAALGFSHEEMTALYQVSADLQDAANDGEQDPIRISMYGQEALQIICQRMHDVVHAQHGEADHE